MSIELVYNQRLNYAAQQNAVPVVRLLRLLNQGDQPLTDLELTITLEPDILTAAWTTRLERLDPGAVFAPPVELRLSGERLASRDEREAGYLHVSVKTSQGQTRESHPLQVLAYNEWAGSGYSPELLAAFSQPNHPALVKLFDHARQHLEQWTGDPAFDGYQSKSRKRVREMAAALYQAFQDLDITYINPPASFEKAGQKVRTAEQVLEGRQATCLDITMFFTAALERAGLHPLVVMLEGHAFPGVWLEEKTFETAVLDEPLALSKRVEIGRICLFDSSTAAARPLASFTQAEERASRSLEKAFAYVLDIRAAREASILPLPSRHQGQVEQPESRPRQAQAPVTPYAVESAASLAGTRAKEPAERRLQRWKDRLLDLSLRNRLLNFRPQKKTLPLQGHNLAALEDQLAAGDKLRLEPRLESTTFARDDEALRERMGADPVEARLAAELEKKRLHLALTAEELAKRAVTIYREARSVVEETGSSTLFLALGMLEWYETDSSDEARRAPILLLPVELERRAVGEAYRLSLSDDEPRINVTLLEKMRRDFGLEVRGLEELPEDHSGLDVPKIFLTLRTAVENRPRWRVLEEAHVGFFSFTKFLMWMDLETRRQQLLKNPIVANLAEPGRGFPGAAFPAVERLDEERPAADCLCPLDADSSQLGAIYAAVDGASFVLQGPPGTGKSQTITNLIAQALANQKTVLFVAEKRAALEVVHRRLELVGLAPFCLELHSNKARKSDVMRQLSQALAVAGEAPAQGWQEHAEQLQDLRQRLNHHAHELHKPRPLGMNLQEVLVRLSALRQVEPVRLEVSRLDRQALAERRQAVAQLEQAAREAELRPDHPWRGVGLTQWLPSAEEAIHTLAGQVLEQMQSLSASLRALEQKLGLPATGWSRLDLGHLEQLSRLLSQAPGLPASLLTEPGWRERRQTLEEWLRRGRRRAELSTALAASFREAELLQLELGPICAAYEQYHQDFFAWFRLWSHRRQLTRAATGKLPPNGQLLEPLKQALELQQETAFFEGAQEQARAWFGELWRGVESDWDRLEQVIHWTHETREALLWLLERLPDASESRSRIAQLAAEERLQSLDFHQHHQQHAGLLEELGKLAVCSWPADEPDFLAGLASRLEGWRRHRSDLRRWCDYAGWRQTALGLGLAALVEAFEERSVDPGPTLERSLLEQWLTEQLESDPHLRAFRGSQHHQLVERFRQLDHDGLELAQKVVRAQLAARVPRMGEATRGTSELGILQRELKKQRRHMSCRKLFEALPTLLPLLKPCVMMSPLSVAQYLDPAHADFDLVVFDEASQITVWDSIGSLARGRQAIVVGDSRQLPPTSFFESADSEDPELDDLDPEDLESILDECVAAGLKEHWLRWHYRSRHESLITFSNHRYYEGGLLTFPAALSEGLGVHLHPVEGHYDRGASRTNRAEAQAIVAAITARLRDPERRAQSLGVVTFNSQQQTLIEDLLDVARAAHPDIEPYFTAAVEEPVFVKNLENVQGDERDVIFFSITFAPDQAGKMTMNFGPINKQRGERRLNVAITRARERLELYSTLRADQIDLNRTNALGVRHLREFLDYAARGAMALLSATTHSATAEAESPLEEQIGRALEGRGWAIHRQVGALGYRIDIGVVHPERPGVYLAGVECDGATYHSSRCARDRDRLRQNILEGLGWTLLRVWSSDWWHEPERELARLDGALQKALRESHVRSPQPTNLPREEESVELALVARLGDSGEALPSWEGLPLEGTSTYRPCPTVEAELPQEAFYETRFTAEVRRRLEVVLGQEAPVSLTEAARRVGAGFGLSRVTGRVRKRLLEVVRPMEGVDLIGDFLWSRGQDPETWREVRLPGGDRAAGDIPLEELANGCELILRQNIALPRADLAREVARLFGIKRLGSKVTERMEEAMVLLERQGRCLADGEMVRAIG